MTNYDELNIHQRINLKARLTQAKIMYEKLGAMGTIIAVQTVKQPKPTRI